MNKFSDHSYTPGPEFGRHTQLVGILSSYKTASWIVLRHFWWHHGHPDIVFQEWAN